MNFHFSLDIEVQTSKKPLHTVGNEDGINGEEETL